MRLRYAKHAVLCDEVFTGVGYQPTISGMVNTFHTHYFVRHSRVMAVNVFDQLYCAKSMHPQFAQVHAALVLKTLGAANTSTAPAPAIACFPRTVISLMK